MTHPSSAWLGRYRSVHTIRSRRALHIVSATRESDASPCVVIVPSSRAESRRAARLFAEIERVHGLLDHSRIPRVAASGAAGQIPYLELACDAVTDGVDVGAFLAGSPRKLSVAHAAGFFTELRLAVRAAHAVTDPRTKRPIALGRLSAASLLFSRTGQFYLFGHGESAMPDAVSPAPDDAVPTFQAPELRSGGAPSPAGDCVALLLFAQSMLPLVDLPPSLARPFSGSPSAAQIEISDLLRWLATHVIGANPGARSSVAEAEAAADRLRELCGVQPDPEGFAARMRVLLDSPISSPPDDAAAPGRPEVTLGVETCWIVGSDGARHLLGQAQRRIVDALAALHRRSPGAVLTIQELLEIGWPGERPMAEAGANRVYVALTHLRRMGMRGVIERHEGGYRFAPGAVIKLSA
jgi:hypothetical protein